MPDFKIDSGWMAEAAVQELASWYHEQWPQTSLLTFEAHFMVLRAYAALVADSPLEHIDDLSRARYNILRMLYQQADQRLLMSDFAQGMNVSATNVTKLVDTLVADGFVTRADHAVDKRKRWAELTPKGAEMVQRSLPAVAEHVSSLWDCLDEREKRILVHLLAKMRFQWVRETSEEASSTLDEYVPAK
jgi:DNA-binding MarR family transcriptional regulator